MEKEYFAGQSSAGPASASHGSSTPPGDPPLRSPFHDAVDARASHHSNTAPVNPFVSPEVSRPASSFGSASANGIGAAVTPATGAATPRFETPPGGQRYFHSRRINKNEVEKPWLDKPDPKEKWVTILPIVGIVVGLAISGFLVWDGIRSVVQHNYCSRLDTDFAGGFDESIWTREVSVGGYGNGNFDMTTSSSENVFVENGKLIIRATVQDAALIERDSRIDLVSNKDDIARWGACTTTPVSTCVAATNTTSGNATIVPPALSGRINTRNARDGLGAIKYGRVEVTAKLPAGDWLWPAIWMMPVDDVYGPWPMSGEIDIMESRGNDHWYAQGGNNIVSSALHWGPNAANNGWWLTNSKRRALKTTYADSFNTFGIEWSQKYIFSYVNSRLLQVLYTNFDTSLWQRGGFPAVDMNGTRIQDPWAFTGRLNTPFDQPFYLILNVAVGSKNGWFEDNQANKPWFDNSPNAEKDFWQRRDEWLPTWTNPQMEVSRVQIWQQCDGNEDL